MAKTKTQRKTPPAETPKPGPGRPAGSKGRDYSQSLAVEPVHCTHPNCLSTDVETLVKISTQQYAGQTDDGFPYTHIIRRRMHCRSCGQYFVARFYENHPKSGNNSPDE